MSGLGLPGVSVSIKGTTDGTNTDIDGKWALDAKSTDVIIISFVGMKTQEIKVGNKTFFKVILEDDRVNIEEVMVVAYGTATKKSFTGSAAKVGAAKIEAKNVSEISKALTGEVAGVNVINSSGQPGKQATVRIRGFGSVNGSSAPLYIVDGVAFDGDISSISPSDIASTTVLKDASATSIYGSRGSNGVIMITTKRGKSGETRIEADFKYGVNIKLIPQYDVITNPEAYTETAWESIRNKELINGYSAELRKNPKADFKAYWNANIDAANKNASNNIFDKTKGFDSAYNMWDKDGKDLINPSTGKFNSGVNRRYTPELWEDNCFNTGKRTEATVKMSGGSDKTSFFTSIGYLNDQGYYIGSDFSRLNTRLNVNHKVGEWLKSTTNIAYSYMESNSPGQTSSSNNGFAFVNSMPSIYGVFARDKNGQKMWNKSQGRYEYDYADNKSGRVRRYASGINPAGAVELDKDGTISHNISANSTLDIKINSDFSVSSTFGTQVYIGNRSRLTNAFYGDAAGIGRIYKSFNVTTSYTWNQLIKYNHSFGDHHFDAFVAHEVSSYNRFYSYGSKNTIVRDDALVWSNAVVMTSMEGYDSDNFLESYFGQLKYDFNNKYFVHATVRKDGSSRFSEDNRWGTFGSLGLAWVVSNEEFMSSIDVIKDLKLKVSYGTLGNQALLDNAGYANYYPYRDLYSIKNLNDKPSFVRNYKGNENLTWERSNSFNIGTSFKVGSTFDVEIDYFRKNTTNLLFYKKVARSLGYKQIPVNDGELLNSGIEFNVMSHIIKSNDFYFDLGINGAHYKNEMLEMPLEGNGKQKALDLQGRFAYAKGHSIRDYYLRTWKGVDAADGRATWKAYTYKDSKGDVHYVKSMVEHMNGALSTEKLTETTTKNYNNAVRDFVGKSSIPDLAGAMNLAFGYKGFSISAQFLYSLGGYSYDYSYSQLMGDKAVGNSNWHKDISSRWQNPGDITDTPRLSSGADKFANGSSTRFLIKNNYIALNNVKISYAIPTSFLKKMNIKGASISVSGDNLWMSSARKGYVPNMSSTGSSNSSRYTPLSSITCGLKLNF
jgi:TonB-linked SusC/RagA family outer membrane protein